MEKITKSLEEFIFLGHENSFIFHGVEITMVIYSMTWTLVMAPELGNVDAAVLVSIVMRMLTSPAGEES